MICSFRMIHDARNRSKEKPKRHRSTSAASGPSVLLHNQGGYQMNRVHYCTKPYIIEGIVAGLLDFGVFALLYILFSAIDKDFTAYIILLIAGMAIALLWDMKTVYPCFLDRIQKETIEDVVTFENTGLDISASDKFTRHQTKMFHSLLETWYYPKEWSMDRAKLIFQNQDQKRLKLRLIWSENHGQPAFWDDLRIVQTKNNSHVSFRVSYCKYSKILLDIKVLSIPADYKQNQQRWIIHNVSNTFRWMLSKKVLGSEK